MSTNAEYLNFLLNGGDIEDLPEPNSVIGSLLKELCEKPSGQGGNIRYNIETDMIQMFDGENWIDWQSARLIWDGWIQNPALGTKIYADITGGWMDDAAVDKDKDGNKVIYLGPASFQFEFYTKGFIDKRTKTALEYEFKNTGCNCQLRLITEDNIIVKTEQASNGTGTFTGSIDVSEITVPVRIDFLCNAATGSSSWEMQCVKLRYV